MLQACESEFGWVYLMHWIRTSLPECKKRPSRMKNYKDYVIARDGDPWDSQATVRLLQEEKSQKQELSEQQCTFSTTKWKSRNAD